MLGLNMLKFRLKRFETSTISWTTAKVTKSFETIFMMSEVVWKSKLRGHSIQLFAQKCSIWSFKTLNRIATMTNKVLLISVTPNVVHLISIVTIWPVCSWEFNMWGEENVTILMFIMFIESMCWGNELSSKNFFVVFHTIWFVSRDFRLCCLFPDLRCRY